MQVRAIRGIRTITSNAYRDAGARSSIPSLTFITRRGSTVRVRCGLWSPRLPSLARRAHVVARLVRRGLSGQQMGSKHLEPLRAAKRSRPGGRRTTA
jgi:hypothetical protein